MVGYIEEEGQCATPRPLLPGAVLAFNPYEFSRAMRDKACQQPWRIFSHIAPYMGGPEKIRNITAAGDGALATMLHDMTANNGRRQQVPNSSNHMGSYLSYSLLARLCKYAHRVS